MKELFWTVLLVGLSQAVWSQTEYSISGTITDADNGETLMSAIVRTPDGTAGALTNEYGFYSFSLPEDSVTLLVSYTGLEPQRFRFYLSGDTTLNIALGSSVNAPEVVVSASSVREKVQSTQMSVEEVTAEEAKKLPAFLGEVDIIKVLQLKPGVQSGGEGSSGLYVRGGAGDQNFFVLDEAPVYNPSHLFGLFSTFNTDAVKNVQLYKAAFPAEYGGRLSSVVDVTMRDGNNKRLGVSGGLGLISSRLTLEGPIVKDKGSFILSGRRTYLDVFTSAINRSQASDPDYSPIPGYYFYDFNAKATYRLSDKDQIFVSGYFGRDVFGFNSDDFGLDFEWGNITSTARWNHIFGSKLFSNTAVTFSDYKYELNPSTSGFNFKVSSGIRDVNVKTDFTYAANNRHLMKFGANAIYHHFTLSRVELSTKQEDGSTDNFRNAIPQFAWELGAYFNDEWAVNDKLKVDYGLRLSGFINNSAPDSAATDYWNIEPRIAARYSLNSQISVKASYARMSQYLHLVAPSAATLPTDFWYPSDPRVKPQRSDVLAGGAAFDVGKGYFLSSEIFYKKLHNQVDFRDGANLFLNPNLAEEFVFGSGESYGLELYAERKVGKVHGWVGYTLSWAWRTFPDIFNGQRFNPVYDRRNDISVVAMWDISKRVTLSGAFVYGTGQAVSLPSDFITVTDVTGEDVQFVPRYTARNNVRMPAYHRLDLALVWQLSKPEKRYESNLTFSIYNVYSRRNAFLMYIERANAVDPGQQGGSTPPTEIPTRFEAKVVSLFPIIPSMTWNFKF